MVYDIQEDAYRIPVQIENREALISANQLHKVVHSAARMEVTCAIAQAREDARRETAEILGKMVHHAITEKLGDELQKRIPQIAQAVLDCDARTYPTSGKAAALRPVSGDLARFGRSCAPAIQAQLDEANARASAQTDSPTARQVLEKQRVAEGVAQPWRGSPAVVHKAILHDLDLVFSHVSGDGPWSVSDVTALHALQRVKATLETRAPVVVNPVETQSMVPPARTNADVAYEARRASLIRDLHTVLDKASSLTAPWSGCHVIPREYKYDAASDSYRRG